MNEKPGQISSMLSILFLKNRRQRDQDQNMEQRQGDFTIISLWKCNKIHKTHKWDGENQNTDTKIFPNYGHQANQPVSNWLSQE